VRGESWGQGATFPLVPASDSPDEAPWARRGSLSPPPQQSGFHPDTYRAGKPHTRSHTHTHTHLWLDHSTGQQPGYDVYSQFGELLQIGEILYTSDVIVLHIKMGEVGGKAKVANVRDLIIIQVKNGEVSTHGEIPLKIEVKSEAHKMNSISLNCERCYHTHNVFNALAEKVEVGECLEVLWEGEAPSLFEVVSRFSNQICGQAHHGGSSQLQRILFSLSRAFRLELFGTTNDRNKCSSE